MAVRTGSNGINVSDDLWYEFWEKSDAQLQIEMSSAARTILTKNAGFNEEFDAKCRFAAAETVMAEKKRRKEDETKVKQEYEADHEATYRKLRAAYTPNGQLVAAILEEEDGKTKEEIASWCEEMTALDDSELYMLLRDLVSDGIIEQREGGKYYLSSICNEDLTPDWRFRDKMRRVMGEAGDSKYISARIETLVSLIPFLKAFYPEDLDIVSHNRYVEENKRYSSSEKRARTIRPSSLVEELDEMVDKRLLIKKGDYYRVPFVGELQH